MTISRTEALPLAGDFDPSVLAEALQSISAGAMKLQGGSENRAVEVSLRREVLESGTTAVIEWSGFNRLDYDPFRSFAGGDGIRMSLAAKVIEEHGGSAEHEERMLRVRLPLSS